MSVQGNYTGGLSAPQITHLTTDAVTTLFEGSDMIATIAGLSIVNTGNSSRTVTIYHNTGASDAADMPFFKGEVPANSTLRVTDIPVIVRKTATIKAQSSAANNVYVMPIVLTNNPLGTAV